MLFIKTDNTLLVTLCCPTRNKIFIWCRKIIFSLFWFKKYYKSGL